MALLPLLGLGTDSTFVSPDVLWHLEEASGTRFDSADSQDLTPINGPGRSLGRIGYGADLRKAAGQYLHLPSFTWPATSFSVALWVYLRPPKPIPGGRYQDTYIFSSYFAYDSVDDLNSFDLLWSQQFGFWWEMVDSADDYSYVRSFSGGGTAGEDLLNNWHFLVFGWDSTTQALFGYVDNVALDNAAGPPAVFTGRTQDVDLGAISTSAFYSSIGNTMDGILDEVGIWTGHVLSAVERTALFNAPRKARSGAGPVVARRPIPALISLALAEEERRSVLAKSASETRINMTLARRAAEAKAAFDREVKRKQYHSIYSLLVAEL